MRRAGRLFALTVLAAALAVAPAAAQVRFDVPLALRPQPLSAELTPPAAAAPSVELRARTGRPAWLLPAAGLIAGAILYPVLVNERCEDCTLYIPEPVTGGIIGLLGGIVVEVSLMLLEGGASKDLAASSLPPSTREPQAP